MSRADDIQTQRKQLKAELTNIQSKCSHTQQHIRRCPQDKDYRWECDTCKARLAYPSQTELSTYIGDHLTP
jgi:hypothetical protein